MHKLYRKLRCASAVLCAAGLLQSGVLVAFAQSRKIPQNPRATAVLVWHGPENSAVPKDARLYPLTLRHNGKIFDANIYRSSPAPMALEQDTVYEVQRSGEPIGFFTVSTAAYRLPSGDWYALGSWQPKQTVSAGLKAAAANRNSNQPENSAPSATNSSEKVYNQSDNTPSRTASGASNKNPDDDPDRPRLKRTPSGNPTAPGDGAPPASRSGDTARPSSPAASGDDTDPDRPVLKRRSLSAGVPQPQVKGDDMETLKKMSNPALPLQLRIGVSDAVNMESRPYTFQWNRDEEQRVRAEMIRMANAELAKASGQSPTPGRRSGLPKAPPLQASPLEDVRINAFDLSYDNSATVVLTAHCPAPLVASRVRVPIDISGPIDKTISNNTSVDKSKDKFITLMARLDTEGQPRKIFLSVTDSSRLDVVPSLQLVDALDVDGNGRGQLLFREFYKNPSDNALSADNLKFIVYKITRDSAEKLFESPGGE